MDLKDALLELSDRLWDAAPRGMLGVNEEAYYEFWRFHPELSENIAKTFERRYGVRPIVKEVRLFLDRPDISDCFCVNYILGFIEDREAIIVCDCEIDRAKAYLSIDKGRTSKHDDLRRVCNYIISQYVGEHCQFI